MHSYSFLKYDKTYTKFDPNEEALQNLDNLLNIWTLDNQVRFITIREFLKLYQKDASLFSGSDYVPVRPENIDVYRTINETVRNNRTA
jgi:hypothetical protein